MPTEPLEGLYQTFCDRLRETVAWCRSRAPIDRARHGLRTSAFCPDGVCAELLSSSANWPEDWGWEIVATVAARRSAQLSEWKIPECQLPADLTGGRLLCFFPDATLSDGAAEEASQGFFDAENIPPWDTWVIYVCDPNEDGCYSRFLLSWVPPELVPLAAAGIAVNPEECIAWAADEDREFFRFLNARGLLQ